jgi:hypothetical protein
MRTPTEDLQAVRSRLNTLEAALIEANARCADLQARLDGTLNDEERAELGQMADACRAAEGEPTTPESTPDDVTPDDATEEQPTGSLIDRI